MNRIRLVLDLSKRPAEFDVLQIRQCEIRAATIEAEIYDNGEPVDLSRYDVYFECMHITGEHLQDGDPERMSVEGNVATYSVKKDVSARPGMIELAYFSLVIAQPDGTREVYATTNTFLVNVLPNAGGRKAGIIKAYSSEIEQMLKYCYDTFHENEADRQQTFEDNEAARQLTFEENEAARQAVFDGNEEKRLEAIAEANAAADNANAAAQAVAEAIDGDLDPLFQVWLEKIGVDVPGGVLSYDLYMEGTFMSDDEFLAEVNI